MNCLTDFLTSGYCRTIVLRRKRPEGRGRLGFHSQERAEKAFLMTSIWQGSEGVTEADSLAPLEQWAIFC